MKFLKLNFSKKIILLLSQSISRIIFMKIAEEYKSGLKKGNNYNVFFLIEMILMLNYIFYLIEQYQSSELEFQKIIKKSIFNLLDSICIFGKNKNEKIKFLFFSLFIIFCQSTREFLSMIALKPIRELFGIASIFMIIYSHFTFKIDLYSHHILSIILITVVCIFSIIFIINDINIKNILTTFINYPLEVFLFFMMKYLMESKFLNPFLLLTMTGFISFIFYLCSTFFLSVKYGFYETLYHNYIYMLTWFIDFNQTIKTIFLFVSVFVYFNSMIFILYHFNPYYEMTAQIITIIITQIQIENITKIILQFGNLFGVLIFSEIIIIDSFGLGDNTQIAILKRAQEEEKIEKKIIMKKSKIY